MGKTTIELLKDNNVFEAVLSLMKDKQDFVGGSHPYDKERFNDWDAIDHKNLLISVPLWAKNTLEVDEFSIKISEKLLQQQEEENEHFWDYNIEEYLKENGYNETYQEYTSGYTYNDSDYNRLERDIHYTVFEYDSDYYVCFSVHYGADARAGFSDSIVLKLNDVDYFHSTMELQIYNSETDEDIEWYKLDEVAAYDEEKKEWIDTESGAVYNIHSCANGF